MRYYLGDGVARDYSMSYWGRFGFKRYRNVNAIALITSMPLPIPFSHTQALLMQSLR